MPVEERLCVIRCLKARIMGYQWINLVLEPSYSTKSQLFSNACLSVLSLCQPPKALPIRRDTGRLPCLFEPRQPSHLLIMKSYSSSIVLGLHTS